MEISLGGAEVKLKIKGARNFAVVLTVAAFALLIAACQQDVKITAPRYALVYGVQHYPNATDLQYTLNDAQSMNDLLASQGWSTTFGKELTARRQDIVKGISDLSKTIGSDATVLLYFSGHGALSNDGTSSIIAPYDTDFLKNSSISSYSVNGIIQIDPSTVISASELASMLAQLPTKNIIVVLDCCYSGNFVNAGNAIDMSPQDYSLMPSYAAFSAAFSSFSSLLSANASATGEKIPIVLSAAGSQEFSYDGAISMSHGVFTYYLLQAAISGDSDGDRVVTMSEAYDYTSTQLKAWGSTQAQNNYPTGLPFLPHLSGGARDLVLFTK